MRLFAENQDQNFDLDFILADWPCIVFSIWEVLQMGHGVITQKQAQFCLYVINPGFNAVPKGTALNPLSSQTFNHHSQKRA